MKVHAVNIGPKRTVEWRGKQIETGIFKSEVNHPIHLGKTDVELDAVVDRVHHGGIDKACYIYSFDPYEFWQEKYPNLELNPGFFGENITVKGLDEQHIQIGDIYQIGDVRVKVTQPRQPCYKLGIRFENQNIIKAFIQAPYPGIYVKIIETGKVKKGDEMRLSERLHDSIGLLEVWDLLYQPNPDPELLEFACQFQHLADDCRASLRKRLNQF